MATKIVTWDFETQPIQPLPCYPPRPVGLAIFVDGESHYYAFGHPNENNCTETEAREVLSKLWFDPEVALVAHNNAFDTAVAVKHWLLPLRREGLMHDTLVMAFLCDPHAMTFALKPLSEKLLGMQPEEADAIRDWCINNGFLKRNAREYGEYICQAPGSLVGTYAIGDVVRTEKLFQYYRHKIQETGMWDAYRREVNLQIIMLQNSFDGVSVSVPCLISDVALYDCAIEKIDKLIRKLIQCDNINLDSDSQLAEAIDKVHPGLVWTYTKTGKRSTAKANMEKTLEGLTGILLSAMQYRASIKTCLNTFMRPWLIQATHPLGKGRIRCQWHTTRGDDGGARTGRLSSSPNFQNLPTLESAKFREVLKLWESHLKELGYPPLPNVRKYVIADSEDHVLCGRDYSGQELRVLAHFEDGVMIENYRKDPRMDMHQLASDMILEMTGLKVSRKQTKSVNFAITYGSGLATLANTLGCTVDEAAIIKGAYLQVLPGIATLNATLKQRADQGKPIRTWGGRIYYVEPARIIDGRWRNFAYKMLNVLVQGSSADITKEACIRYDAKKVYGRLVLSVHDELVMCCPKVHALTEMAILKDCMESIELDVKLVTDGEYGQNWFELTAEDAYEEL